MRTITPFLLLLAAGVLPARAQLAPAGAPVVTVEEAVRLAIGRNPRLQVALREIRAAQAGVRSARALTNPRLVFTPGITSVAGSDEELLVQQPLEINGTRQARTEVARAQLRQTHAEAVLQFRELVAQTKTAYYELARAQELRSIAEAVLQAVEEFDRGVRRQAEEGLRAGIDALQTGIEVARARQQLSQAEAQVRVAQAALNSLMGRPPGEPILAVTPIPFTPEPVDRDVLITRALVARAEIEAETALREQFQQQVRLVRAEGRPDLVPQLRAGRLTRGFSEIGLGLGITLPLFDYGSRRNRIRQAQQAARAQEARIEAARAAVRAEVEQAITRLQAAEEAVRSYQAGVLERSRRLLEASMRALQVGAPGATILTVLEAQRTYRGVLTEYINALANHAQARAELERATGAVPADLLPSVAAAAPVSKETQP